MNPPKLVLHHTYLNGAAFDVSGCNNHGSLTNVWEDTGTFPGTLRFSGGTSQVDVEPSESMRTMRGLAVKARFRIDPAAWVHRHNLVEGHLSFALMVQRDRSVMGTIHDRNGNWDGPSSAPGAVTPGRWHEAVFMHDGISRGRMFLDGTLVDERWDLPGPVRDISAYGLSIGHWPGPDAGGYTLEGHLDEVMVWRDDPAEEVLGLLDPCCLDRPGLDDVLDRMREAGVTKSDLDRTASDLLDLRAELSARVRDGDPARGIRAGQITASGMVAARGGDEAAFSQVLATGEAFALEVMSRAELQGFGQRVLDILNGSAIASFLPGNVEQGEPDPAADVAAMLCLDRLVPRGRPHPDRPRRTEPTDPGNPDTDLPPDRRPPRPGLDLGEFPPDGAPDPTEDEDD